MKLSPIDCEGEEQTCKLDRSWVEVARDWSILTDGYEVSLSQQPHGESPIQHISIPKKHFDKMVKWYLEKQQCPPTKNEVSK